MIIKIICSRNCKGVFILWPKLHVESSHFYGECTASWALFICSLSTLWTLLPYNMFLPIYLLCCAVLSRSVMSDSLGSHGLQSARLLCPWGFCRQEYWSGLPCPPPGDFPNPGIKPRSPTLQADSFTDWAIQGSLRILEWVAYPFSRGSSWPRNQTGSPALQVDSLPAGLPEKPTCTSSLIKYCDLQVLNVCTVSGWCGLDKGWTGFLLATW